MLPSTPVSSSSSPVSPLVDFYHRLARHDWLYSYSDDPGVYHRGRAEQSALEQQAKAAPEFQQLYQAYQAYIMDSSHQLPQPPCPAPDAPVTWPAPPVASDVLNELSEDDRLAVQKSRQPHETLRHIQARQALDATLDPREGLKRCAATPDPVNPDRWMTPDGRQVRLRGQAWVVLSPVGQLKGLTTFVPQAQGEGTVRLVAQLQGVPPEQVLTQWASPVAAPEPIAPSVASSASVAQAPASAPAPRFPRFGRR